MDQEGPGTKRAEMASLYKNQKLGKEGKGRDVPGLQRFREGAG